MQQNSNCWKYSSTRGGNQEQPLDFVDAVLTGLADDGGLMVPIEIPQVQEETLDKWQNYAYADLAFEIMRLFIDRDSISDSDLQQLVSSAYGNQWSTDEICPTVQLSHESEQNSNLHILELFHGPTFAFKDVALQFLGVLFDHCLRVRERRMVILGATSGDTGSAAIYGVKGKPNIDCFILYPHGRTSRVQELQMVTVPEDNIHCLAVDGTFDDCQAVVKELFTSEAKQQYHLGAVNSINWARILAQIVYYFYSSLQVRKKTGNKTGVVFSVPTGNFGDILAGYYAQKMCASMEPEKSPIKRLVVASNTNDILTRFLNTGVYEKTGVTQTMSPSMDIEVSSNFERFLYDVFGGSNGGAEITKTKFTSLKDTGKFCVSKDELKVCQKFFAAYSVSELDTLDTVQRVFCEYKHQNQPYMLCPHSAVGFKAAERFVCDHDSYSGDKFVFDQDGVEPVIVLATAHMGKFTEHVIEASKQMTPLERWSKLVDDIKNSEQIPEKLSNLHKLEERKTFLAATQTQTIASLVLEQLAASSHPNVGVQSECRCAIE